MKNKRTQAYLIALLCYFCVGAGQVSVTTSLKSLIADFNWTDSQGGLLISIMSIGNLLASTCAGLIMQRIGRRGSMLLCAVLLSAAFAAFAAVPSPMWFYPILFAIGMGNGMASAVCNMVVSDLYPGSTSRLNVVHAMYAAGAIVFPMIIGFTVMGGGSWRLPIGICGAICVLWTVSAFTTRMPEKATQQETGSVSAIRFWREYRFYFCALMFFIYVGVETAVCSWLPDYLHRNNEFFRANIPPETMVSLMWGMIIIGRLTVAAAGQKVNKHMLTIVLAVGFLVGLAGVVLFVNVTALVFIFVIVMGLSMSALFACCITSSERYVAVPLASGMLFGCGGLGSGAIPGIAGIISDAAGLQASLLTMCGFLGVYLAIAVSNLLHTRKHSSSSVAV